ncbi:universal stress protein [Enterococcus timonensis]|uniref:universal stress protein n=1 Tax=Enterococcus timonensis TaxID=1852364 RepID=UPI0008DB33E8|nr:universal stress protein [Enterococcus timonensis]
MHDHYENILVAVDESEQAQTAFIEAVAIAKRNQGKLTVAAVADTTNLWGDGYGVAEAMTAQKEAAQMVMDVLVNSFADGLTVEKIIEVGSPKSVIAKDLPEKYHYDLIVMGATGKGAIERVLLGSTTNFVVTHAPCNVMVVK